MTQCILLAVLLASASADGGTVRGRVVWVGEVPAVPQLIAPIPDGNAYRFDKIMPNPFAPQVRDGGMSNAVVWLVGGRRELVEVWKFLPVTVEQVDHALVVRQGERRGPVGIVPVISQVQFVSRDPGPTTIRLRGAEFVTLPFPGPDKPTGRLFRKPGVVEVTSGAMLSWAACDLIAAEHQFYAITDETGRFELPKVPPGEHKLVCRVRNWHEVGHDRDPETGLISRRRYAPPVVLTATVRVPERGTVDHTFTVSSTSFPPR